MHESQVILGWIQQGLLEGGLKVHRKYILRILQLRFRVELPPEVRCAVDKTADFDTLDRWIDAATADSIDSFKATVGAEWPLRPLTLPVS